MVCDDVWCMMPMMTMMGKQGQVKQDIEDVCCHMLPLCVVVLALGPDAAICCRRCNQSTNVLYVLCCFCREMLLLVLAAVIDASAIAACCSGYVAVAAAVAAAAAAPVVVAVAALGCCRCCCCCCCCCRLLLLLSPVVLTPKQHSLVFLQLLSVVAIVQ